jgi:hypothetical protein
MKVHNRSFISNVKLEVLNLSNNLVQFDSDDQPIWDQLTSLKILDLSRNQASLL